MAVLNLSVAVGHDPASASTSTAQLLQSLFKECAEDPFFLGFPEDTNLTKDFLPNTPDPVLGESIFSAGLRRKILGQKHFFARLALEAFRAFPAVQPQQFFNLMAIVRKYAHFFNESTELDSLPLVSLPLAELFDSTSGAPNAKMTPFLNFMEGKVR